MERPDVRRVPAPRRGTSVRRTPRAGRRELPRRCTAAPALLGAARGFGVTGCLLICQARPDIIRRHLDRRRGDVSDADWAVYQAATALWEPPGPQTRAAARPIDTGGSVPQALAHALVAVQHSAWLATRSRHAPSCRNSSPRRWLTERACYGSRHPQHLGTRIFFALSWISTWLASSSTYS